MWKDLGLCTDRLGMPTEYLTKVLTLWIIHRAIFLFYLFKTISAGCSPENIGAAAVLCAMNWGKHACIWGLMWIDLGL